MNVRKLTIIGKHIGKLSTAVAAAHPNKTAPFLRARGTDGRFARHVQSPIYVDSRVTQGLEAPPRTSTSHLATDHGSRPPVAQLRSELSLATRSGLRTMEATCGNGYAPVRGTSQGHARDDDDDIDKRKRHFAIKIVVNDLNDARTKSSSSSSSRACL